MKTEDKILQLKRLASQLNIVLVALIDPEMTPPTELKATSVKKVLGVSVADGHLPISEFDKALEQ